MRLTRLAMIACLAALVLPLAARADWYYGWGVYRPIIRPRVVIGPAPVVVGYPPLYVQPAPVYVPPPVYYAPAPVYPYPYYSAPVFPTTPYLVPYTSPYLIR